MATQEQPIEGFTFTSPAKTVVVSRHPSVEFVLQPLDNVNLKKLLVQVTGQTDTESVSRVKIKVVTRDAGLHRLADYTPRLRVLVLDGSYVDSLRDLGSSLKVLETLSVVGCSLKSLDGLWGFRSLNTLIARDNSIKNPSPCSLVHKLTRLDLANNEIDDPASFVFLQNCKRLRILDVNGNVFDNYRNIMKSLLPQIRILDGEDIRGAEVALRAIEGEESCGNESDLKSEDEDLISFLEDESSSFLSAEKSSEKCSLGTNYQTKLREKSRSQKMGAGDIETNDASINEENVKILSERSKNRGEGRSLDSSSSSIFLLTHEFDRLSMIDLSAINVGDIQQHHCLETIPNKLSSGRAICGNLAASLRARNSHKNPFTLPSARVGSGAEDNNDAEIN